MNINQLPPELILCIGDHLRRAPLNALIQTSKSLATTLTPLLYHKACHRHFRPPVDDEPEPRVRSIWVYSRGRHYVSQRRLWACVPHWESEYIMQFFLNQSLEWAQTRFGGKEKNGATWLHLFAAAGHVKLLRMFMEKGLDVHSRDWAGNTVLHSAAAAGQNATIDVLLEAGADVLAVNQSNQSVLVYALKKHNIRALIKIIHAVEAKGGDLNSNSEHRRIAVPPIFLAVRIRQARPIVSCLLDHDVDLFQELPGGDTLLHWAASLAHEDIGKFLLSQMKNRPGFISNLGMTHVSPLHIAIQQKALSLALSLINLGADLEVQDSSYRNALDLAICYRCYSLFGPIFFACTYQEQAIKEFEKALSKGIKTKDHYLVRNIMKLQDPCFKNYKFPDLHSLIDTHRNSSSGVEIIEILGDATNPDFYSLLKHTFETPLHAAIRKPNDNPVCSEQLITYLLHRTHSFSHLTREGNSILHHAARYSTAKTVEQILKHPALTSEIFEIKNNLGNTALHEAVRRNGNHRKMVKLLMQARTKFEQQCMREKISARSPRKIGKPAVPDPPVREEVGDGEKEVRWERDTNKRGSLADLTLVR